MEIDIPLPGTEKELNHIFHKAEAVSVRNYTSTGDDPIVFNIRLRIPEDFKYDEIENLEDLIKADRKYALIHFHKTEGSIEDPHFCTHRR